MTNKQKAQQRTNAQFVLYAVEIAIERLYEAFSDQPIAVERLDKIMRWQEECKRKSMVKRPSAGSLRDIDNATQKIEQLRGECVTPDRWAEWLICLSWLAKDVRNTYHAAKGTRHWRFFVQTFDTLVKAFAVATEHADAYDNGWDLYVKACECLPYKY